jgi:hypothetical protein
MKSRRKFLGLWEMDNLLPQFGVRKIRVCMNADTPEETPYWERVVGEQLVALEKLDLKSDAYLVIARLIQAALSQLLGVDPALPWGRAVAEAVVRHQSNIKERGRTMNNIELHDVGDDFGTRTGTDQAGRIWREFRYEGDDVLLCAICGRQLTRGWRLVDDGGIWVCGHHITIRE